MIVIMNNCSPFGDELRLFMLKIEVFTKVTDEIHRQARDMLNMPVNITNEMIIMF